MDLLQFLGTMGESPVPVIAAFFIGLMTAISPCPLATNITAIAFMSKKIDNSRHTLLAGFVYTLGRMAAYIGVASAIVLLGMNIQIIALGLQHYGDLLLGPFLVLCGIYLLDIIPFDRVPGGDWFSGVTSGISARLAEKGYLGAFLLGVVFALSFCPFSAVLLFAMLIPLALTAGDPVIIPAVFALATGLPVMVISFLLAQGIGKFKGTLDKIGTSEVWLRLAAAGTFIVAGLYQMVIIYCGGH
ncbi:aromatic aminobenezylarsenical efflux permease ArsG family transporter [Methanoregula sp. PtaB.Bin085]|uniref:aromatic aminobenezylarsenical efflux permease ArsG family transporter n=1 Tax=Methanoregula sp. PtaB.Bin085 TaxID=1811680 RepID=UPI0009C8E8DC|nr:aromatic aminobenezylarsenical efflux permease ArsG family transporter [Methanoregula sp. PtaB.Bin085]OPX64823.1 MAG: Cytochrome C biogenesis protein transmembrane region [Methanoregula sp. PtaB.Bin085]